MAKTKYYKTSQEWFDQSILLIEARPSTTRITTKYSIKRPRIKQTEEPTPAADATPRAPRAKLTLKTFDPVSGATLKYKTTKAAEVNRLIQVLGKLSKGMAGLKGARDEVQQQGGEVEKEKAPAAGDAQGASAGAEAGKGAQVPEKGQAGGGGKKKKKGKR